MNGRRVVHHFGPDPATVGGMATVIRLFTEHRIGGDSVDCHPTWTPDSQAATARLMASSTRALMRIPASAVAHVHLSESGSFVREGSLVALARRRGLLTAVTMHGAAFMPFARKHPRLAVGVLRRAHLVTCLDEEILDFVRSRAPHTTAAIVPNPIHVEDSYVPADATEELVVFAGEIGLRKGADVLCEAWRRVVERRPKARCLMVGPPGDFQPPCSERLEVRPAVGPQQMERILQSARVVVLPSRAERLPMVLTEAMSLARPFVSTPVGGIPELASCGAGRLVEVEDEAGLAREIVGLLASPARARASGEAGRDFCLQTRSVQAVGERFRELYSLALSRPAQAARA